MKTKYKYLVFKECNDKDDPEHMWQMRNREGELLGYVGYRTGWRQHVIDFDWCHMSAGCLRDAAHFLDQLNKTKGCYKEKGSKS